MAKKIDTDAIIGERYGRLTIVRFIERKDHHIFVECKCDCGNTKIKTYDALKTGNSRSCGCFQNEVRSQVHTIHGLRKSKLYKIWDGMKGRCCSPKNTSYPNYGGRGIKICDEWKDSFTSFYEWAMSNGYSEGLSIDRIDNDGNYEPSNCRWATNKEQGANKRNNIVVTYNGETHIIAEWARITGIKAHTLRKRYKEGYRGEKLFSKYNLHGRGVLV